MDIDSPEIESDRELTAKDFAFAVLKNKRVRLDIEDFTAARRDNYGRSICVAYLTGIYDLPLAAPNFNCPLVYSGHAGLSASPITSLIHRIGGPDRHAGRGRAAAGSGGRSCNRTCRVLGRKGTESGGKRGLGLAEGTDRGLSFLATRSQRKDASSS